MSQTLIVSFLCIAVQNKTRRTHLHPSLCDCDCLCVNFNQCLINIILMNHYSRFCFALIGFLKHSEQASLFWLPSFLRPTPSPPSTLYISIISLPLTLSARSHFLFLLTQSREEFPHFRRVYIF